jgi:hypothetical protein
MREREQHICGGMSGCNTAVGDMVSQIEMFNYENLCPSRESELLSKLGTSFERGVYIYVSST